MMFKEVVSISLLSLFLSTIVANGSCPRGCKCYPDPHQRAVDCSSGDYTTLPSDLPSWLGQLDMSFNKITHLDANAFKGFPDLTEVKMKANGLRNLPQGLFDHNPLLRMVDFTGNLISEVPKNLFANNPGLQYLTLEDNNIKELDQDVFSATTKLIQIKLAKNYLTSLPKLIFDKLILLEVLQLKQNLLVCCNVVDALAHVDTDVTHGMGGSCVDPKRRRIALEKVVLDKTLKCPGRPNPNPDSNVDHLNNMMYVLVGLVCVCVLLLIAVTVLLLSRSLNGRGGFTKLLNDHDASPSLVVS